MNEIPLFLMELAIATAIFFGVTVLSIRVFKGKEGIKQFLICFFRHM